MVRAATKIESGGRGEDRVVVERKGDRLLIVVADGAGGTGGGAAAAQAVCDAAVVSWREDGSPTPWGTRLKAIDVRLMSAASGGQTTVVVAEVVDGRVQGASVGDSAAWMLTPNGVYDLTASQVRKPLLGTGAAVPTGFDALLAGRLLIGSDGLFKYVRPARIVELASRSALDEAVAGLVDAARLKNGRLQDDVAVVLCELVSAGLSRLQDRWRAAGIQLNPGASAADLADLDQLVGVPAPQDVRAFYETADGMVDHQSDGKSLVSFWSIGRILRERDVIEGSDELGPYRAVAFADVLIYSWCFRFKVRPGGAFTIVADGASWELPSFETFLSQYVLAPSQFGVD